MVSRSQQLVSLAYIYLILSADPINAFRLKAVDGGMVRESEALFEEFEALSREHAMMEEALKSGVNSTEEYIGESWASCAQRKIDFERRERQVKERYDGLQKEEGSVSEAGWMLLKAYSLVQTYLRAKKQGCDWVHDKKEGAVTIEMLDDMKTHMPCYDDALATLEGQDKDAAAVKSLSILLSEDCKPIDVPEVQSKHDSFEAFEEKEKQVVAFEEKEEQRAAEGSKQLKTLMDSRKEENPQQLKALVNSAKETAVQLAEEVPMQLAAKAIAEKAEAFVDAPTSAFLWDSAKTTTSLMEASHGFVRSLVEGSNGPPPSKAGKTLVKMGTRAIQSMAAFFRSPKFLKLLSVVLFALRTLIMASIHIMVAVLIAGVMLCMIALMFSMFLAWRANLWGHTEAHGCIAHVKDDVGYLEHWGE